MKVLVVGQGGREHVLVWKLSQSPGCEKIYCAPGNAGTAEDATNIDIAATDTERLVRFAVAEKIDLAVIGPEAPLVAGLADALVQAGIRTFGPSAAASQLEGSKAFAKEIMRQAKVPTADYRIFTSSADAISFIEEREEVPLVVKADGLAAGKGVVVCSGRTEAIAAVRRAMEELEFGEAGRKIVIEECLVGQEVSILAVVDGTTIVPLEAAQDHKAAFDGDQGPNTGGMGAYSPAPFATPELMDTVIKGILVPTVHTLAKKGMTFRGILYAGLMLTSQGPKVLEFNVRFGDPEAQPVLMRLKTDLLKLLVAAADGKLDRLPPLEWDPRPALCVVMASEGYPGDYAKGLPIRGLEDAAHVADAKVFHAGTTRVGDQIVTDGGRVLGVTAIGHDLSIAKRQAYAAVKKIRWEGAWCRKDISDKARLA
jgi:phosphoribosylamine--glycine ligase